jgi:TPR repeat protein
MKYVMGTSARCAAALVAIVLLASSAANGQAGQTPDIGQLRRAAERGDDEAQYRLGIAYRDGVGVPQDDIEAHVWLSLAANFTRDHAQFYGQVAGLLGSQLAKEEFLLGLIYMRCDGVPADRKKALEWLRKAGAQGDSLAQHTVGTAYFTGNGRPQDYGQAVQWWRKAAEQGLAEAQFDLGDIQERDDQGVARDYREAARWYRTAA